MADANVGRAFAEYNDVRVDFAFGSDLVELHVYVRSGSQQGQRQGAKTGQPACSKILTRRGHIPDIGTFRPKLSPKSGLYGRFAVRACSVQVDQNIPWFGPFA